MTADHDTRPRAHAGSKFEASADNLLRVIPIDVVAERTRADLEVRDNASSRLDKIIAAELARRGYYRGLVDGPGRAEEQFTLSRFGMGYS